MRNNLEDNLASNIHLESLRYGSASSRITAYSVKPKGPYAYFFIADNGISADVFLPANDLNSGRSYVVANDGDVGTLTLFDKDGIQFGRVPPHTAVLLVSSYNQWLVWESASAFSLSEKGFVNAYSFLDMQGMAGDGAALQTALDTAEAAEWWLRIGSGVALLDYQQVDGVQTFGLGTGLGAGKKYVIKGDTRRLVTLLGAENPADPLLPLTDFMLRFSGIAEDPVIIDMSGVTLDIGDSVSVRPMVSLRNSVFELDNIRLIGRNGKGGGITGTRYSSGEIRNCIVNGAMTTAYSFAPGLNDGEVLTPGNHPVDLHIQGCKAGSPKGNGFNLLGAENSSVNEHRAVVDVARYGYLGPYNAERVGNGCMNIEVNDCLGVGFWRGLRIVDVQGGSFVGNSHRLIGSCGLLIRKKDTPCQDLLVNCGFDFDLCRGVGQQKPASDPDGGEDEETDTQNRSGRLILGGENIVVTGKGMECDARRVGWGRLIAVAGNATVTIVDDNYTGKNLVGASRLKPGDILYFGDADKPLWVGRSAVIGGRTFHEGLNGSGAVIGTAAYGGPRVQLDGVTPLVLESGNSSVQTITLDGGSFLTLGDIAGVGNAGLQSGVEYRIRRLSETVIDAVLVALEDPLYFNPGIGTITVETGSTAVTMASGLPAFDEWVDPSLGRSICMLFGSIVGKKVTLGQFASVTDANNAVLTANGLQNYTGVWWFSIENKMQYGMYIGGVARDVSPDWDMPIIGAGEAPWHVEPECIHPQKLPAHRREIPAQTVVDTADGTDALVLPTYFAKGRQRLWNVSVTFKKSVFGDAVNNVRIRIQRDRVGVRLTIGAMDIGLTDVDRVAGATVVIAAPVSVNDSIPATALFEPGDLVVVNLYAVGAGGDVPDMPTVVPMVGW